MRSYLLLPIALASLALASPLPDIEPVEYTPRPSKTMTCDCSKVTECPEKRPKKRSTACLTQDVVDSVIADVTYFLTQASVDPAGVNSTAERIFTENLEIWSGGMKFLAGLPLGDDVPALSSRSSFVELEYQPPYGQVVSTIDVFFTCRKIAWRWSREYPDKDLLPISGITTFDMIYEDEAPSTPTTTAPLTTTTPPSTETVAIIPPECPYGDASDGVFNGGICPAQPKQRRAVPVLDTTTSTTTTTTTTSTAANATQTLDKAALDLLAALADDEPPTPQTEGPGCAPGNSPGGDPNAGDCEEVKRDAVANDTPPPTADRDRDVDIDNFKLKLKRRNGGRERDARGGKRDLTNPPNPHTLPDTEDLPANRNPDAKIDGRDMSASTHGFAALVKRAAGGVVNLVRRTPGGPSPELTSEYTRNASVPSPEMLSDDEGAGAVGDDVPDDVPSADDAGTCDDDEGKTEGHQKRDGDSRKWRIRKLAIEFNSGAWVRNLGGTCGV